MNNNEMSNTDDNSLNSNIDEYVQKLKNFHKMEFYQLTIKTKDRLVSTVNELEKMCKTEQDPKKKGFLLGLFFDKNIELLDVLKRIPPTPKKFEFLLELE